ncbi:MAG: sugar ABC transporter permease [Chloroflexota bacterium]|nr:sugar ABC transporter permease [Chloroflexota bacterium]
MSTLPTAAQPAGRGPITLPAWRRGARPYLLVLPAIALTIGILYPFVVGATYAFQNFRANRPDAARWVGLDNFRRVLTDDEFWRSALITAEFSIAATVVETLLGIGVALLLARSTLLSRVLERLLIMPLMIAPVIAAIIWRLMMLPTVGVLNYLLAPFGLGDREWTGSPGWALFSIVLVDVWTYTPFVALLVLAGLRSLPRAPFEAAAVEGAGFWYTFRNLTLPMLWPYVLVAVIFRFMDSLKVFDIIQVLTAGGPGDATMSLQVKSFEEAITFSRYSLGQTYMFILWALVYVATRGLIVVLGRAQARAAGV